MAWLRDILFRIRWWRLIRQARRASAERWRRLESTAGLDFQVGDRVEALGHKIGGIAMAARGKKATVVEVVTPCCIIRVAFDECPEYPMDAGCCEFQYAAKAKEGE